MIGKYHAAVAPAVAAATRTALEDISQFLASQGCEVVLCAKIGYEPWTRLEEAGIMPNGEHAMEPIEDAVMAVWHEMLAAGKLDAPAEIKKRA